MCELTPIFFVPTNALNAGLAATMFEASFSNENGKLGELREQAGIDEMLDARHEISPEEYTAALDRRRGDYGQFPIEVCIFSCCCCLCQINLSPSLVALRPAFVSSLTGTFIFDK